MSKPGTFVPNSFQTPNGYVDEVMPHLTGEELKVLLYATRRILGFQKRQDRISISQFTDGLKNKDGEVLDSGTGLSVETVKKCLANLVSFNLMLRISENDPKTNDGTMWSLQWDGTKVNWDALEKREKKKQKVYKIKMAKARSMRHTPTNGIEGGGANGIEGGGANGIETQKTVETQRNKEAATPRSLSSSELEEIKTEANKKVDALLENERKAIERQDAGTAWRGRELCPPSYLPYGDWWHSKTKQHMYGSKGKQKVNTEWLKAFKEFYENEVPISVLEETYSAEIAWKKIISKPSELITKAIAIAALPPAKETSNEPRDPFASFMNFLGLDREEGIA